MGCSASIMKPMDITSMPCARSGLMCLPSGRFGLAAGDAHHERLAGTVDVRIQESDPGPLGRPGERQIGRDGRLADAALAGCHGDDVLDAIQRFECSLYGVRGDLRLEHEL